MKPLKTLIALTSLLASACIPDPVVGVWAGRTSGCTDSANDDVGVTVVVTSDRRAALATTLGLASEEGSGVCSGGAATIDDETDDLSFTAAPSCREGEFQIEYQLSLTAKEDDSKVQSGRIAVTVNGAVFDRCDLTLTREE